MNTRKSEETASLRMSPERGEVSGQRGEHGEGIKRSATILGECSHPYQTIDPVWYLANPEVFTEETPKFAKCRELRGLASSVQRVVRAISTAKHTTRESNCRQKEETRASSLSLCRSLCALSLSAAHCGALSLSQKPNREKRRERKKTCTQQSLCNMIQIIYARIHLFRSRIVCSFDFGGRRRRRRTRQLIKLIMISVKRDMMVMCVLERQQDLFPFLGQKMSRLFGLRSHTNREREREGREQSEPSRNAERVPDERVRQRGRAISWGLSVAVRNR